MDGRPGLCYGPRVLRRHQRAALGLALATVVLAALWLGPVVGVLAGPLVEAAPEAEEGESLREALSTAIVRHGERPCTQTGDRFVCGASPWLWVGRHVGRATSAEGPRWRPCIWAHPPDARNGRAVPVTITFPEVHLGAELHGEAAILDVPRSGEPVSFTVRVGARQRARLSLTDGRDGDRRWQTWTVPTGPDAGQRADVTFEISAPQPSWRQVCFTAFVGSETVVPN